MRNPVHQNRMEPGVQQHFGQIGGRWIIAKYRSHIRADEPKELCHDAVLSLPVLGAGAVAGALLAVLSAAGVLLAPPSAADVLVLVVDSLVLLPPPLCAR